MVIINVMWLLFMLVLNGAVAQHLRLLGTNPLGVMFIFTYGALFVLQFLTMLVHRFDTLVQFIATVSMNDYINSRRRSRAASQAQPQHTNAGPRAQEMQEIVSGSTRGDPAS